MPDYAALTITAHRLIHAAGGAFVLRRYGGSSHDPVTGDVSGGDWDEQVVEAVFLPPAGPADQYDGLPLDMYRVRDVIIAGHDAEFEPAPLDQIHYHGDWWVLRGVSALSPAGDITLLWRGWAVAP